MTVERPEARQDREVPITEALKVRAPVSRAARSFDSSESVLGGTLIALVKHGAGKGRVDFESALRSAIPRGQAHGSHPRALATYLCRGLGYFLMRGAKSQAVLSFLASNPTASRADVVEALAADGITVSEDYVTTVKVRQKASAKKEKGTTSKASRKQRATPKKRGKTPKVGRPSRRTSPKKTSRVKKQSAAHSAKYPRHSIEQALRIPRAILDQNAGRPCTTAQAALFVGVGNHGPFRLQVSSAIKYGFIEREHQNLKLTDLAKQILRPQKPSDEIDGYRTAVMRAPSLGDAYEHYRGENLPDDKFFENTAVEKFGVPREKFPEFKEIFVEGLRKAKLVSEDNGSLRLLDFSSETGHATDREDAEKRLSKASKGVLISAEDTCFVMQPFASPWGTYYHTVYEPAIRKAGLMPVRADADIFGTGKIMDQIWHGIQSARVLVAELTTRNPNVFYELGLAHALGKPVVLVTGSGDDVPFDLKHIRTIYYDTSDPFWGKKLQDKVAENIISALERPEEAVLRSIIKAEGG